MAENLPKINGDVEERGLRYIEVFSPMKFVFTYEFQQKNKIHFHCRSKPYNGMTSLCKFAVMRGIRLSVGLVPLKTCVHDVRMDY